MDDIETFKSPDKNNFISKPENLIGCLTTANQVQIETRFKIKVRVPRYQMFHISPIGIIKNPRFVYRIKNTQTIFKNLILSFKGDPHWNITALSKLKLFYWCFIQCGPPIKLRFKFLKIVQDHFHFRWLSITLLR